MAFQNRVCEGRERFLTCGVIETPTKNCVTIQNVAVHDNEL